MIKSITFTGEFGYITNKVPEPMCKVRGYNYSTKKFVVPPTKADKEYITKEYIPKMKEWEKHKDEYTNPALVKNLLNRKIEFEPGKINIIFGKNASGKTTILKAIAGNAGTVDGYTKLASPLSIPGHGWERKMNKSDFKNYLDKLMCNSAKVEWDGSPVYYDNFANRQSHGSIGDLCGSVLGDDIATEVSYLMNKDKISLGQNSMYLLHRLMNIANQNLCYADLFSQYIKDGELKKDFGVNDTWDKTYRLQLNYYLGFEKSFTKSPSTFLFDEIDKSLDIANIYTLYTEVLPVFAKETGVQIILISHSPLVLSNKIRNNEMYNLISIDEEYTNQCIENLNNLFV